MTIDTENLPAVLVVEDEVLIRMDLVEIIEEAGYRTYEAGSADAAIKLMERHDDIGILFTDIEMPGSMDGLKLAAFIKGRWPPVVLIIASGNVGLDVPDGATFLAKPYSASLIGKTLEDASRAIM